MSDVQALKLGSHPKRRFINADDIQLEYPFRNLLELDKISSWDEVEIACASNGIEVTQPVLNFFIVGMMVLRNITDMMISAFNERTWMVDRIKTVDDMSLVYMTASTHQNRIQSEIDAHRSKIVTKWYNAAEAVPEDFGQYTRGVDLSLVMSPLNPIYSLCFRKDLLADIAQYRTKIFNAIDMTNPFILLQFYSSFEKERFADDIDFIKYLVGRTQLKAKYNDYFKEAYRWLKEDLKNINMYKMFMQ